MPALSAAELKPEGSVVVPS